MNYVYDRGGQVTAVYGIKVGDRYDYIKQIRYDEFGQRVYLQYGNNAESRYNYNPARRWLDSFKTIGTNGVFQDTTYSFDKVGNVLSLENKAFNVKHTYRYDDLDQLVQADGQSAIRIDFNNPNNLGNSVTSTYSQSFSYDTIGNLTSKSSKTGNEISNDVVRELLNYKFSYVYEGTKPHAPSRIGNWSYRYDDNGNTIERIRMQGAEQIIDEDISIMAQKDSYQWDEENRLKQSYVKGTYTDYRYDYTGQRSNRRHNQGEYIYVSPFYEMQYFQKLSKHIFVGDTRLVVKISNYVPLSQINNYDREVDKRNIFVLHQDHLGSTNVISDYEGKLYEHLEYTPYGETFVDEAPNATEHVNYKFTGKEYDPESLLYYFGARYHDALFSRWISPDPGEEGLNWYEFSNSNPINYHDPDGNAAETVWDVVNIGMGVYSFVDNVKRGDALGATVDAVGVIADTGAALLPFVPGGAGTAIRAVRVAQKAEKIGNAIVAARDVVEGVGSGDVGQVVSGMVALKSNVPSRTSGIKPPLAKPGEDLFVGTYSKSYRANVGKGISSTHTPHHSVQDAVSKTTHGKGVTINLRKDLHEKTRTFKKPVEQGLLNRQHLARDVRDIREILLSEGYNRSTVNTQLQELIRQNKAVGNL